MISPFRLKTLWVVTTIFIQFSILSNYSCRTKNSNQSIDSEECTIDRSEIEQASGLALEIYYPCSWTDPHLHDDDPEVIKQVGIMPDETNGNLSLTIMSRKLESVLSSKALDELRHNIYLDRNAKVTDESLESDTLEINGMKGGEIVFRKILPSGQVYYTLVVQLYVKDNFIQLIYGVGAPTEREASSTFQAQKGIFQRLARKTKLLSGT